MTKQQECELIDNFVRALPKEAEYLTEIFIDLLPDIKRAISNDFTYVSVSGLEELKRNLQSQVEAKQKELKKLEDSASKATAETKLAVNALSDVKVEYLRLKKVFDNF